MGVGGSIEEFVSNEIRTLVVCVHFFKKKYWLFKSKTKDHLKYASVLSTSAKGKSFALVDRTDAWNGKCAVYRSLRSP